MVDDYEAIRNKAVPVYQGGSSSPVYQLAVASPITTVANPVDDKKQPSASAVA